MSDFQSDIRRALGHLKQMDGKIIGSLPAAAQAAGVILRQEVEQRAPVGSSGRLKASVGDRPGDRKPRSAEHLVYVGAFYSYFVEYGTRKMAAQPFVRPAADSKQREMADAMRRVVIGADGL